MLLTKLFSGLLAAVMVALGAGQIGNKNTQVGDELVVREAQQSLHWYYKSPSTGLYSYLGQHVGPPSGQSCTPPEENPEICLKGLMTLEAPEEVTDITPDEVRIFRESSTN